MYLLECNANLKPIMTLVGWVVFLIQIGIPIILIVLGMIDLGKAVMASKEDEIKSAQKLLIKRCIYAVAIFFVVFIVQVVFGLVSGTQDSETAENATNWMTCWGEE